MDREDLIKNIVPHLSCIEEAESKEDEFYFDSSVNRPFDNYQDFQKALLACPFAWESNIGWVSLSNLYIEKGVLLAGISDYRSGPPDYHIVPIGYIPDNVLVEAWKIISKQQ